MGSQAQDARHERILNEAQQDVDRLERALGAAADAAAKAALAQELEGAKSRLSMQINIDQDRD